MSTRPINYIGDSVRKTNPKDWTPEASKQLAADIGSKVLANHINVRIVQQGDNLGRIAEGLSRGEIQLKDWKTIQVIYLGDTNRLNEQKSKNPSMVLMDAGLIHPGQFVVLKDSSHLLLAERVEQILNQV